jgi:ATP-dependent exoDNAse (exonuclease V) beta subunit
VFAGLQDELLKEEINLLYVALTRARREIEIPRKYLIAGEYTVEVPKNRKLERLMANSREPLF